MFVYLYFVYSCRLNEYLSCSSPCPCQIPKLKSNLIPNVMIFCRWGLWKVIRLWGFSDGIHGKDANAGDISDVGLIPGLERSLGGERGTPLQCSCLENPHGQRSQRVGHDWSDLAHIQSSWTPWNLQEDTLLRRIIGSSAGKQSACNAGDSGSFPGLGRSPGEWIGYPFQYSWASLVTQKIKNPPAMWKTWVRSLSQEDPLEDPLVWQATPVF